ncbi:MAG: Fic family protein [Clostridiales Family XIII bacterium]|jgi:Fic family protein|nr:Fic family protein [Clostridiales Family XIII bacterium]
MTQTPPHTITLKAADYLTKIAEAVTRLEFGTGFKRDIRLHRENRVRSIYSSLAIEGNPLTLGEVTAVIDGKLVAGGQAEIKEVKNAFEAYDKIMEFDPYSVKDFLKAHKLMTDGLVAESGVFRNGDVGVFDGDVVIHMGARPQFVPQLVSDLLAWAKKSELHPILKSAIIHCEIETIHPFADGNGRMGRLWQTLLLAKWKKVFAWIPMESVVFKKRQEYYQALQGSQRANDSGGFIEFTLSALLATIEQQVEYQVGLERSADNNERSFERRLKEVLKESELKKVTPILDFIEEHGEISPQEARIAAGKSEATVWRYLKMLCERGILESTGNTSAAKYYFKR